MKPMPHLFFIPNYINGALEDNCLIYTDWIFSNIHEVIMHSYEIRQIFL